jgi:hypothetical protein
MRHGSFRTAGRQSQEHESNEAVCSSPKQHTHPLWWQIKSTGTRIAFRSVAAWPQLSDAIGPYPPRAVRLCSDRSSENLSTVQTWSQFAVLP